MPPNGKDRESEVDFCIRLADRATARFESRRAMEWNTHFGLWTLLGGASVALIAGKWNPSIPAFLIAVVGLALLFLAYWCQFLPWLGKSLERDMKTAYFWETMAQKLSNNEFRVPENLRPYRLWPDAFGIDDPKNDATEYLSNGLHEVQKCQLAMTFFLVFFLGLVMGDLAFHEPAAKADTENIAK